MNIDNWDIEFAVEQAISNIIDLEKRYFILKDENEQLKKRINKALDYINKDYSVMESNEIIRLEEILKGETNE